MTRPRSPRSVRTLSAREIDALREQLERRAPGGRPASKSRARPRARGARGASVERPMTGATPATVPRWNADPDDVRRSVAQLVLALVEFLRKLLERQAIRRMENETLSPDEVERIGLALMRLEETVHELARQFDLDPEDLNLDLGPLGRLS